VFGGGVEPVSLDDFARRQPAVLRRRTSNCWVPFGSDSITSIHRTRKKGHTEVAAEDVVDDGSPRRLEGDPHVVPLDLGDLS
jgi:hypothetical protein